MAKVAREAKAVEIVVEVRVFNTIREDNDLNKEVILVTVRRRCGGFSDGFSGG